MRHLFYLSLICFFTNAVSIALQSNISQEDITLKGNQYTERLGKLEDYHSKQLKIYKTSSPKEQKKLLAKIRVKLEKELTQYIFPAWYGTPWDFNGTSNRPGKGKIACGYFVSTTLKHIGFKIDRYKLAQQPSQRIITTFVKRSDIDISSCRPLSGVKKKLEETGDGIYIIGLDTHVGFVAVKGKSITFIHSSYYRPDRCVVAESYNSKNPLSDSKYRVVGKLFHDEMLINWLSEKPYKVTQ